MSEYSGIAIVHEWWARYGGAETVVSQMINSAEVEDCWILNFENPRSEYSHIPREIRESWLSRLTFVKSKKLRVALSPVVYRTLTLKKYKTVILSSHTFAHTAKLARDSKTTYLSYVYTPSRSLWLPTIDQRIGSGLPYRLGGEVLKKFDKKAHGHVQSFVSISKTVQDRLRDFWEVESQVIYPPVDIEGIKNHLNDKFEPPYGSGDYLVSAGRFVPYKQHAFSLKVAKAVGMPIVIMGSGPEETNLRRLAEVEKINARFIIAPDRTTWVNILAHAHSLLFPAEEDFGIVPIESICVGTPVIAYGRGAASEYVSEYTNGKLIPDLNLESWTWGVNSQMDKCEVDAGSVSKFNTQRFDYEFRKWINENTY